MNSVTKKILGLRIWRDTLGQDLIEWALMAAFVAVAAGAVAPLIWKEISPIFEKISCNMVQGKFEAGVCYRTQEGAPIGK